jgi:acetyl-CoA C-acetyltransferase
MGSVWIAGSYQSDFARNYAREGLEISDMVAEAVAGTLEAAGVAAADVEAIHVGNAFGQLFTGQVHVAVHVQPAGRRVRPPLRP